MTRILIEGEDIRVCADLHHEYVTTNKHDLHCKGGTVVHIWDYDTSVSIHLTEETFNELRKRLNEVYKWDHISERTEEEE